MNRFIGKWALQRFRVDGDQAKVDILQVRVPLAAQAEYQGTIHHRNPAGLSATSPHQSQFHRNPQHHCVTVLPSPVKHGPIAAFDRDGLVFLGELHRGFFAKARYPQAKLEHFWLGQVDGEGYHAVVGIVSPLRDRDNLTARERELELALGVEIDRDPVLRSVPNHPGQLSNDPTIIIRTAIGVAGEVGARPIERRIVPYTSSIWRLGGE